MNASLLIYPVFRCWTTCLLLYPKHYWLRVSHSYLVQTLTVGKAMSPYILPTSSSILRVTKYYDILSPCGSTWISINISKAGHIFIYLFLRNIYAHFKFIFLLGCLFAIKPIGLNYNRMPAPVAWASVEGLQTGNALGSYQTQSLWQYQLLRSGLYEEKHKVFE